MSISVKEIAWVAGLLEGEGSFGFAFSRKTTSAKNPIIALAMTDIDVVEQARKVLDRENPIPLKISAKTVDRNKPLYRFTISGSKAVGWMMTIYPLMGARRRAKIHEIIALWKTQENVMSLSARHRMGLLARMKTNGYTDYEIQIARVLSLNGFSDEKVLLKLKEL